MICPFAIQHPGHPDKVNGPWRHGYGLVLHSAYGYLDGMFSELADPTIELSWHFSIDLDGNIYQHYDTTAQCWHSRQVNGLYGGIEIEGKLDPDGLETDAQVAAHVKLIKWWSSMEGWIPIKILTLFEHNQFVATACPQGRIRWADIMKGLNMANPDPEQVAWALISAGQFVRMGWNLADLTQADKDNLKWVYEQTLGVVSLSRAEALSQGLSARSVSEKGP